MSTNKSKIDRVLQEQLGISQDEIKPELTLEDLGADSLDTVELLMGLEEAFEIEIPDAQAERFYTVNDLYEYLNLVNPTGR